MDAIKASACVVVLVDYQARLMPTIHDSTTVIANALLLARAAHVLGIPVLGTEQNPAGLGPNVTDVKNECARTLTKTYFDACSDGLVDALREAREDCDEVIVAGCEAHVCLMQTSLGLLRAGKRVWVVESACGSRRPTDHAAAMQRLARAGAMIVTHEMVLFEWLLNCDHPRFKDVLKLIKAAG
jgi:nicotinamidase-related amidase